MLHFGVPSHPIIPVSLAEHTNQLFSQNTEQTIRKYLKRFIISGKTKEITWAFFTKIKR